MAPDIVEQTRLTLFKTTAQEENTTETKGRRDFKSWGELVEKY